MFPSVFILVMLQRKYWLVQIFIFPDTTNTITTINCNNPKLDLKSPQRCIVKVNCDPKYEGVLAFGRTSQVDIKAEVVYNCNSSAYFEWIIWKLDSLRNTWIDYSAIIYNNYLAKYGNEVFYKGNFTGYNLREILFEPLFFPLGLYEIRLSVIIQGKASSRNR